MEKKALTIKMDAADMAAIEANKRFLRSSTATNSIREAVRAFMPLQDEIRALKQELAQAKSRNSMLEQGISQLDRSMVWAAQIAGEYREGRT